MISFNLVCGKGHGFEGWFRSGEDFDRQAKGGVLECPVCGGSDIAKGLMAPAIARGVSRGPGREGKAHEESRNTCPARAEAAVPATAAGPAQPAMDPQTVGRFMQLVRQVRDHVERNFENVGDRFVSEARAIHTGEAEERGIYGEATLEDARELHEEGIAVIALPNLPKLDG